MLTPERTTPSTAKLLNEAADKITAMQGTGHFDIDLRNRLRQAALGAHTITPEAFKRAQELEAAINTGDMKRIQDGCEEYVNLLLEGTR